MATLDRTAAEMIELKRRAGSGGPAAARILAAEASQA